VGATHNTRGKPAARANTRSILQKDERNRCKEGPNQADQGTRPLYAHLHACCVSTKRKRGETKRQIMETHIGEHLRCEQRECSRNSRPNHGIDSKGRRGKHPTCTGLSTLMTIIAHKISQICIHEVALQHKSRSAHASRWHWADIPGTKGI